MLQYALLILTQAYHIIVESFDSYDKAYILVMGLLVTMVILYLQRNEFRNEMLMCCHDMDRLTHTQLETDPVHRETYPSG